MGDSGILIGTKGDEERDKLDCGVDDSLGDEVLGVMTVLGVNSVFLVALLRDADGEVTFGLKLSFYKI